MALSLDNHPQGLKLHKKTGESSEAYPQEQQSHSVSGGASGGVDASVVKWKRKAREINIQPMAVAVHEQPRKRQLGVFMEGREEGLVEKKT